MQIFVREVCNLLLVLLRALKSCSRFSFALVFLGQKRGLSLKIAADLVDHAAQKGWQCRFMR
jgi:hypothetical protein